MQEQLETLILDHFGLYVHEVVRELAAGHINVGSLVRTEDGDVVVQRLNDVAFSDPNALMANTELILNRLEERNLSGMRFLRSVDGAWLAEADGGLWRC